jgi:hypothetical protein
LSPFRCQWRHPPHGHSHTIAANNKTQASYATDLRDRTVWRHENVTHAYLLRQTKLSMSALSQLWWPHNDIHVPHWNDPTRTAAVAILVCEILVWIKSAFLKRFESRRINVVTKPAKR